MSWLIAAVEFGFQILLRLHPWEFRVRFAKDMRQAFGDAIADAARHGIDEIGRVAIAAYGDVAATAGRQQLRRVDPIMAGALAATVIVMLVPLVPVPVHAQNRPDFTGEWSLNREASMLVPEVSVVESGTIRIEHREPEFRFSRTFNIPGVPPQSTSYVLLTDGREQQGQGPRGNANVSSLRWDGTALILSTRMTLPQENGTNVVRYELLESGRTLRATEQLRTPQVSHDNVWIFDRR